MRNHLCKICGSDIVPVCGEPGILIVGEEPEYEDLNTSTPFQGKEGDVLRAELGRCGLSLEACQRTYLWPHPIPKKKEDKLKEIDHHFKNLLLTIQASDFVLILGADLCQLFFERPVSLIGGTWQKSRYIPGVIRAMPAPAPKTCLNPNGVVGDFRIACERFANDALKRKK